MKTIPPILKKILYTAIVLTTILLLFPVVLNLGFQAFLAYTRHHLVSNARVGMSRSEVVRQLGKPTEVLTTREDIILTAKGLGDHPIPNYHVQKGFCAIRLYLGAYTSISTTTTVCPELL